MSKKDITAIPLRRGLSPQEVETLIEYSTLIKKRLDENVYNARIQLVNFGFIGNEWEVYMTKKIIDGLKEGLDKTQDTYRQYIIDLNDWKI